MMRTTRTKRIARNETARMIARMIKKKGKKTRKTRKKRRIGRSATATIKKKKETGTVTRRGIGAATVTRRERGIEIGTEIETRIARGRQALKGGGHVMRGLFYFCFHVSCVFEHLWHTCVCVCVCMCVVDTCV